MPKATAMESFDDRLTVRLLPFSVLKDNRSLRF
jgi:hypothetical protein